MFRLKTRLMVMLITGGLVGCGAGGYGGMTAPPPPPPPGNTIAATDGITFSPATLTVNAGETVTFTFGSVPHNVFFTTQDGAPADIAGNNSNVAIDRQFTTAGTYQFSCHIHPSMRGTVVVQ